MSAIEAILQPMVNAFESLFRVGGVYSLPVMSGALIFCVMYYIDRQRERGRRGSVRGFIKSIFPRKIVHHRSTRIDLAWWVINLIVLTSAYGFFVIGEMAWREVTVSFLTRCFGEHAPLQPPVLAMMAIVTIAMLLAYEFGYWIAHYFHHAVPALWQFHKTHHSAEVMTTLTEMRTHPVELVLTMNAIAFFTGAAYGASVYAFGPGARPFTLFNANIFLMFFIMTVGHLRHTNIWIAFRGNVGKIFQSPAHHRIHHSANPEHFNKNLGFSLAVWDWVFGTLYVPNVRENITIGVGAEHVDFDTLAKSFTMPFVRAAEPFLARLRQSRLAPPASSAVEGVADGNARGLNLRRDTV